MSREIRWGILSTAKIGRKMVAGIGPCRDACVHAVASRTLSRAGEWAKEHGIPRAFGSYDEMLRSGEIDAVYNPLPNSMHAEWTIKALEARLPVLCEKPFTATAAEAREVAAVSKRMGVIAVEAFTFRFHPIYDKILDVIRRGEIGELRSIRSVRTFRLLDRSDIRASAELAGGALMDVGCYCISFSRLIAGAEPTHVMGVETRSTVDDTMLGVLEFPKGVLAQFECSMERHRRFSAEIEGTDGMITMGDPWIPGEGAGRFLLRRGEREEEIVTSGGEGFHLEAEDFVRAVKTRIPPRWPVGDAVANMEIIDALYQSARERRAVALVKE